nr:MAG TPA: hypothetical protein [Caudoviricetes sp.]
MRHKVDSLYSMMEKNHDSKLNGQEFQIFTGMNQRNAEISKLSTSIHFGKIFGYEILKRAIDNFREYYKMHEEICDRIMPKMFDVTGYKKNHEYRTILLRNYFKQIMQFGR